MLKIPKWFYSASNSNLNPAVHFLTICDVKTTGSLLFLSCVPPKRAHRCKRVVMQVIGMVKKYFKR